MGAVGSRPRAGGPQTGPALVRWRQAADAFRPHPMRRPRRLDSDPDHAGWRKVVASVGELVGRTDCAAIEPDTPPPLPTKPSIVVLPFTRLSADADQDYFADGMWRKSSRRCRGCRRSSSSAAARVFHSRDERQPRGSPRAGSAFASCWKAACARRAAACGSPSN